MFQKQYTVVNMMREYISTRTIALLKEYGRDHLKGIYLTTLMSNVICRLLCRYLNCFLTLCQIGVCHQASRPSSFDNSSLTLGKNIYLRPRIGVFVESILLYIGMFLPGFFFFITQQDQVNSFKKVNQVKRIR